MKAFNSTQFKKWEIFVFEFLPQITLLMCLFGYMDLLIIVKWLTDYSTGLVPPSIITTMINMPLNGGLIPGEPFFGTAEFNAGLN